MMLGVLWMLFRRQLRSAIWLGIPTVLLFLVGSTPIAETLVAAEEMRWEGVADSLTTPADAVVALGGGERVSHHDPLGFALFDGASRLLTAIELVRSGKAKTLVLGGSGPLADKPASPSMVVVQDWVVRWGLVNGALTNLGICMTTHDEAVAFKKLMDSQQWQRVILVTSALHMRRSEALFRKRGINVIPVAADFEVWGVPEEPVSLFPRVRRLYLLTLYAHEKIGWWVYRLKGWV